ncbi:MAG: N-acetyltransferase [Candidatus Fonsibacter sp.]|nr:N-acetyltransferase [Candidatus Fonsibacter sp.]
MIKIIVVIREEKKSDNKKILLLEEDVLGPGRYARPSFRLRENLEHNAKYSKVYCQGQKIIGSIRYFNCKIQNQNGLMLGPLIVDQKFKGRGIGRELVNKSMSGINQGNINFIILIGEFDYYGQFGFEVNTNIYFTLNVRKEKVLLKKLSEKDNMFSGRIELY